MGLVSVLFGGTSPQATYRDYDNFWYNPFPTSTSSGAYISPEGSLGVAAVYACVRVLAESVGMLPLVVYRRLKSGGKERATDHPLYELLHSFPNQVQTSLEWREQGIAHILLRGSAYSRIIRGRTGGIEALEPLAPEQVRPRLVSTGRLVYEYREKGSSRVEMLNQDDVFVVRGLSLDGINGLSVVSHARETIGLSLVTERYAAKLFGKGALIRGLLQHPGKLSADTSKRVANSIAEAWSGEENWHKVGVLEEGMTFQSVSMTGEDTQYIDSRKFSVVEVCRLFRVPPHMVMDLERATFSNIEHQSIGFVTHSLMPWLRRYEAAISRDLIADTDQFYAEFLVDGLLRGDTASRFDAYASAITNGWLTRNEVRELENRNPIDGLDEPLTPLNMSAGDEPEPELEPEFDDDEPAAAIAAPPAPAPEPPATPTPPAPSPRAAVLAAASARVVVKRECEVIRKHATSKHLADTEGWRAWVDGFYARHGAYVAEMLAVPLASGQGYAKDHRAQLLARGLEALEDWETGQAAAQLVDLALQEEAA